MKKMIVWLLLVTMLLGTFAGCGSTTTEQTPTQANSAVGDVEGITSAIDYLKLFYKDSGSKTGADFERFATVRIAGVPYEVVWTADVSEELVKAVANDDGTVTIDVSEDCSEDTPYVLTATISDDAGNSVSHSWNYILPAGLGSDYCAIVDMAYALEKGAAMESPATLVGTITAVNTPWSEEYKNITVTIIVAGREDKPIECYRLKGEGAKDLAVGDLITVTGIIKNYNGKIEFDAGSEVVNIQKGAGNLGDIPTDPAEIVDSAYALEQGAALPYTATLTGEVTKIDTPYSADYKNITVTMKVEGREDKPIVCYRLKGTGVETLMPGDMITVTGTIKNYNGTIEFDAGSQLVGVVKGENSMEIPTDPDEILKAAFSLKSGEYLPYPATLTGTIVGLGQKYSEQYGNITVSITTGAGYYIKCYRMKGVDIDKIWLGDEITVTGNIMNYDGTIEFAAGSVMVSWVDKPNPKAPSDPKEIVKAAYKLSEGSSLPYYCTLTGTVIDAGHYKPAAGGGTRTLVMEIEGKEIEAYKLTGTGIAGIKDGDVITVWGMLKNYWGTIEFDGGCKLVSKQSEVVEDLFDLEPGESMEGEQVLTGKVTAVTIGSGSSDIKIKVKGKTILCSGLTGYGYDKLEKKDTVTVRGILENKNGVYQFQNGCELQSWSNYNRPEVNAISSSNKEIAKAASQLGTADRLYNFALTGNIIRVDDPYSKEYENITVTIKIGSIEIQCYRMKGEGVEKIGVGDRITIKGNLINYKGTIEFEQGCKLAWYKIASSKDKEAAKTAFAKDVEAALALKSGETLDKLTEATLEVTSNPTKGNYGGWYFYASDGTAEVLCYYVDVTGGDPVKGAKIKISGHLTNYNGKIEFTDEATCELIGGSGGSGNEGGSGGASSGLAKDIEAVLQLGNGGELAYTTTVTGTITDTPVKSSYNDTSWKFTVSDGTASVLCYYVPVTGGEPTQGAQIKVSGKLKNYNGTAEFTDSATAELIGGSGGNGGSDITVDANSPLANLVAAVKAGTVLDFDITVTGTVKAVYDNDDGTKNIPIITSADQINCNFVKDNGTDDWDNVAAGDKVTMTGRLILKNGKVRIDNAVLVGRTGAATEEECKHEKTVDNETLAPTCGATGLKNIVCDDCGETIEENVEIPATGEHSFAGNGETCDNCTASNPNYVAPGTGDDDTTGDDNTGDNTGDTTGGDDITA